MVFEILKSVISLNGTFLFQNDELVVSILIFKLIKKYMPIKSKSKSKNIAKKWKQWHL